MFASKLRWWCIKMIQLSIKWARMSRFMGWDYITSLIYGETPNPISHYYYRQLKYLPATGCFRRPSWEGEVGIYPLRWVTQRSHDAIISSAAPRGIFYFIRNSAAKPTPVFCWVVCPIFTSRRHLAQVHGCSFAGYIFVCPACVSSNGRINHAWMGGENLVKQW